MPLTPTPPTPLPAPSRQLTGRPVCWQSSGFGSSVEAAVRLRAARLLDFSQRIRRHRRFSPGSRISRVPWLVSRRFLRLDQSAGPLAASTRARRTLPGAWTPSSCPPRRRRRRPARRPSVRRGSLPAGRGAPWPWWRSLCKAWPCSACCCSSCCGSCTSCPSFTCKLSLV